MRRLTVVVGVGVVVLGSGEVRADSSPSVGARLNIGGGMLTPPGDERGGLFELAARVEALWGGILGFLWGLAFGDHG